MGGQAEIRPRGQTFGHTFGQTFGQTFGPRQGRMNGAAVTIEIGHRNIETCGVQGTARQVGVNARLKVPHSVCLFWAWPGLAGCTNHGDKACGTPELAI